jgi:hypothetical protein
MNRISILCFIILAGCGGTLTEEQRKQMRENMEAGEIRKVTDAELTDAAFAFGRKISGLVQTPGSNAVDAVMIDSLEQEFGVKILLLEPADSMLAAVEQQIIEAYTSGSGIVELTDNVQNMHNDTLLYTKPVLRELPDGTTEFTRALGIRMPVKSVVLSIED